QLMVLGKCLDVNGAGTANGTTVDLYDCNGTGAQVWVHQSNGAYLNPNSGKCLDDTGWGGSGTQSQIWACSGNSKQSWSLPYPHDAQVARRYLPTGADIRQRAGWPPRPAFGHGAVPLPS